MSASYSIVCPFRDEAGNLPELYDRLSKLVPRLDGPCQMLFVDDGSIDGGAEFFEGRTSDRVVLVRLDRGYGQSVALLAGIERATGTVIILLDADMQVPPEEMLRMIPFLADADLVTGIRRPRMDPPSKRFQSRLSNFVRRRVLGDPIVDVGCSLMLFRKPVMECFYPYVGIHRFFTALAFLHGFRVKQVPVAHNPRRWGRSKYGLRNRSVNVIGDLLAVRWMVKHRVRYKVAEMSG